MEVLVNGEALTLEIASGESLGAVLSRADELLEASGLIIVSLAVDGSELDSAGLDRLKDAAAASVGKVEIDVEPASAVRAKALSTLLELLALARESSALDSDAEWRNLASSSAELEEAFAGLFSAEELSFVRDLSGLLARAVSSLESGGPDASLRAEIDRRAEGIHRLAEERLNEISDPEAEMRKTALVFRSKAAELSEIPVYLQTGQDDRAMSSILVFIETFNKVIRLMPELGRSGFDAEGVRVDGAAIRDFYASFNQILRDLVAAFEDKDAVRIGDLVEYEVAPRMESFFAATLEALDKK